MNTQPIRCRNCGNLNLPTAYNCTSCGNVLQLKKSSLSLKSLIGLVIALAIPILCCGLCQLGKGDRQSSTVNTALTTGSPTTTTLYNNKNVSTGNSLISNSAFETNTAPKSLVSRNS